MTKIGNAESDQVSIGPEDDRKAVLGVISACLALTIEELLRQLPWMRWGCLFSILGDCIHEGLLFLSEKERCQFEVRMIFPQDKHSGDELAKNCPVGLGDR
jgi:hypothetical protein